MILRILAALCCLVACCVGCQSPAPSVAHRPPALRVLTYNTHHGEGTDGVLDLERIARVINESGADLVALQEIDDRAARTGSVDQAAEYARLTGMHHAFAPFMDFQGGRYGLAVLSRYPIDNAYAITLPDGMHEPRVALAADIDIPGAGAVTFVNLHLDWLREDTERYAQAQALIGALDGFHPVILAGDFNDTPDSRTMRLFDETYTNAAKPEGARPTFPAGDPDIEIDFIMYRPAPEWVGQAQVLDETVASDHRPVLAVLEWRR